MRRSWGIVWLKTMLSKQKTKSKKIIGLYIFFSSSGEVDLPIHSETPIQYNTVNPFVTWTHYGRQGKLCRDCWSRSGRISI